MSQKTYELRNPDDQLVVNDSGFPASTETGVYLLLEDPESERFFAVGSSRTSFKFDNWNGDLVDVSQSGIVERDLDQVRVHEVRGYDSVEGIDELEEMFDSARQDQ